MKFANTKSTTVYYQAAAMIAFNNPKMSSADIKELLGAESKADQHSVDLGVWKAHKKLNLRCGYAQEACAA